MSFFMALNLTMLEAQYQVGTFLNSVLSRARLSKPWWNRRHPASPRSVPPKRPVAGVLENRVVPSLGGGVALTMKIIMFWCILGGIWENSL